MVAFCFDVSKPLPRLFLVRPDAGLFMPSKEDHAVDLPLNGDKTLRLTSSDRQRSSIILRMAKRMRNNISMPYRYPYLLKVFGRAQALGNSMTGCETWCLLCPTVLACANDIEKGPLSPNRQKQKQNGLRANLPPKIAPTRVSDTLRMDGAFWAKPALAMF